RGIELPVAECHGVASRQNVETAITVVLAPECQPDRHELGTFERPVAYVTMPVRDAAVSRVLRHDAVVVRLRDLDRTPEYRSQTARDGGGGGPFGVSRVACIGLKEAPHGAAAGCVVRGRRAGILHVGFIFERRNGGREM